MASWMVHLRIADALLAQLKSIDKTAFTVGNMAPDSGVPNSDWTKFEPPYDVSHFKTQTDSGSFIDTARFCETYLNEEAIRGYSQKAYSFFLGYYVHLLTDVRWSEAVSGPLAQKFPQEYAQDKKKLVAAAKEDWYDLDFLYLREHPDFRAFRIYENAAGFENEFLDIFSKDAFENRRQYICGFYRGEEHGDLTRAFRYLTPRQAQSFVDDTAQRLLRQIGSLNVH